MQAKSKAKACGRRAIILLSATAMIALSGCGEGLSEPQADRRVNAIYETRGQIVSLPDPANPTSEFMIHHEAIDDFVHQDGVMRGMNAMVMPFPAVADDVSFYGIEVGDIVVFSFDVAWEGDPKWMVTAIEEIDPATELVFRQADPTLVPKIDESDHDSTETP
ncbi:MAG: copper-binding protein [Planctomycetota bacterium]